MINDNIKIDEDLIFMLNWACTVSSINKIDFPKTDFHKLRDDNKVGDNISSKDYSFEEMIISCYKIGNIIRNKKENKNDVSEKYLNILFDKIYETMYVPSFK